MNWAHAKIGCIERGGEGGRRATRRRAVLRTCFAVLSLPAWFAGSANAGSMTLLDSSYHVWGHAWAGPSGKQYDKLADRPVTSHVEYSDEGWLGDEVWSMGGGAATSTASIFSASAAAIAYAAEPEGAGGANAFVESITRFRTTIGQKDLVINYYEIQDAERGVSSGHIRLSDVTSGEVLINSGTIGTGLYAQTAEDGWPGIAVYEPPYLGHSLGLGPYWESYDVTFDPSHTYELAISIRALPWPGEGDNIISISTNLSVPAPGAILLGALGAGFVGWLRRREIL